MDLKRLAREKGTNLKRVAEQCGIPPSTLYAISRGDTNFGNVGIDTAIKVANALGMTVEELYMGKDAEASEYPEIHRSISPAEQELVDIYRNLNAHGREQLMVFARGCAESYPLNTVDSVGA